MALYVNDNFSSLISYNKSIHNSNQAIYNTFCVILFGHNLFLVLFLSFFLSKKVLGLTVFLCVLKNKTKMLGQIYYFVTDFCCRKTFFFGGGMKCFRCHKTFLSHHFWFFILFQLSGWRVNFHTK